MTRHRGCITEGTEEEKAMMRGMEREMHACLCMTARMGNGECCRC